MTRTVSIERTNNAVRLEVWCLTDMAMQRHKTMLSNPRYQGLFLKCGTPFRTSLMQVYDGPATQRRAF